MNKAQNLPNNFIYALAAALGIKYSRAFSEIRKSGRMTKLWALDEKPTIRQFNEFKRTVEAMLPGTTIEMNAFHSGDTLMPFGYTYRSIRVRFPA